MKSASLLCMVLATRPPTSTRLPAPNTTPLGLSTQSWPLALSWPWIWLASPATTRFRATELVPGWLKRTAAWLPMSKPCQLMTARSLPWLMVICLPFWPMLAWPAATWAPVGNALAGGAWAQALPPAATRPSSTLTEATALLALPWLLAVSGAGI
jgi:hypothetical protein